MPQIDFVICEKCILEKERKKTEGNFPSIKIHKTNFLIEITQQED